MLLRAASAVVAGASLRSAFTRLSLSGTAKPGTSLLHTSAALCAAPLKKKKRTDPAMLRNREERKQRKLTKALKKMSKRDRIMRPISEVEASKVLKRERHLRVRSPVDLSEEILDERSVLQKSWSRFSGFRHRHEIEALDLAVISQQRALSELRSESEYLYAHAVSIDPGLIPFQAKGPTKTLPIPEYIQDGEYKDITKKFEVQYADTKAFMSQLIAKRKKRKKKDEDEEEE